MESWRVRTAANWLNVSTPVGLALAGLTGATMRRGPRGLLLACHYRYGFPVASAFTVGSVVLTRHSADWLLQRPRLLAHEERHSWQYAACGGLPFVALYLLGCAWSWARRGDAATGNPFEQWAGLADGGYVADAGR